jgi:hypothetical protein
MKFKIQNLRFKIFGALFLSLSLFLSATLGQTSVQQTLVLDGEVLTSNRKAIGDKPNVALNELVKQSEKIVKAGKLYSVMNKKQVPPSGDKHDYMSQAPYWWADPSKPNGLPYIRRDGERNPELDKLTDKDELGKMMTDAELTSIDYFYTGNQASAKHSANLLRTWFLDKQTKMNPNLNFGQGIPGINSGRGIGIIETRELYRVIDAAILLQTSKSWTEDDHKGLKKWFADYAKWLTNSNLGKDEAKAKNNHGTHYDAQLISFLIFTDQAEIAKKQLETTKQRIKSQIEKDGSQPEELARTLSWNYSFMNLYGFLTVARLAEHLKIDLLNYETDGKGLKKAVEYLNPYVKGEKKWTYQQIKSPESENVFKVYAFVSRRAKSKEYNDLLNKAVEFAKPSAFELLTR